MNGKKREKSYPTTVPDKNYSLKQIEAIIRRNDDQFAFKVLAHIAKLEKAIHNK